MAEMNREQGLGNTYYFEGTITGGELVVRLPRVSPTRYCLHEIGWQVGGSATVYGTMSQTPQSENAIWQEIEDKQAVNSAVTALKFVGDSAERVVVRAIYR